MKSFFTLVLMLISVTAAAEKSGKAGSGGGNAVVCFADVQTAEKVRKAGDFDASESEKITSIEMLELFMAKKMTGLENRTLPAVIVPKDKESIASYSRRIIGRLKQYTRLYGRIHEAMKIVSPKLALKERYGIDQINDHNYRGRIGRNCAIFTVIAQFEVGISDSKMLEVRYDERIFNHKKFTDPVYKDINIYLAHLHELFYYVARKLYQHETSEATTALLSRLILEQLSFRQLYRVTNATFEGAHTYYQHGTQDGTSSEKGELYKALIPLLKQRGWDTEYYNYNYGHQVGLELKNLRCSDREVLMALADMSTLAPKALTNIMSSSQWDWISPNLKNKIQQRVSEHLAKNSYFDCINFGGTSLLVTTAKSTNYFHYISEEELLSDEETERPVPFEK